MYTAVDSKKGKCDAMFIEVDNKTKYKRMSWDQSHVTILYNTRETGDTNNP